MKTLLLTTMIWAGAQSLVIDEEYDLGVIKRKYPDNTKIIGWQVGENTHFGYVRTLKGKGAALIWKKKDKQINVTKDGVTFIKRF